MSEKQAVEQIKCPVCHGEKYYLINTGFHEPPDRMPCGMCGEKGFIDEDAPTITYKNLMIQSIGRTYRVDTKDPFNYHRFDNWKQLIVLIEKIESDELTVKIYRNRCLIIKHTEMGKKIWSISEKGHDKIEAVHEALFKYAKKTV